MLIFLVGSIVLSYKSLYPNFVFIRNVPHNFCNVRNFSHKTISFSDLSSFEGEIYNYQTYVFIYSQTYVDLYELMDKHNKYIIMYMCVSVYIYIYI